MQPASRRPPCLRLWVAACAVVLSLSACQKSSRVDIIAANDAGLPANLEELAAWYPAVPDDENAALVCEHAIRAYHGPDSRARSYLPLAGDATLPAPNVPLAQEMRSAIGQFLITNDIALDYAARAAAMSKSRFPLRFTSATEVDFPHLARMRDLTRLLALKSVMKAESNDSPAAVSALRDTFRLPELLKPEPFTLSQLVRIACRKVGFDAVERVANRARLSDAQLAELQALAQSLEDDDMLYRAYVGDRCLALDYVSRPENATKPEPFTGRVPPKEIFERAGTREVLKEYETLIAASRLPTPERREQLEMVKGAASNARAGTVESFVLADVAPLASAYAAHDEHRAMLRVMACGFAVKRYRFAQNAWPPSLAALVPEYINAVPEDSLGSGPLKFKQEGASATVYSVGRDGDDDGGQGPLKPGDRTEGDIIFRCYPWDPALFTSFCAPPHTHCSSIPVGKLIAPLKTRHNLWQGEICVRST